MDTTRSTCPTNMILKTLTDQFIHTELRKTNTSSSLIYWSKKTLLKMCCMESREQGKCILSSYKVLVCICLDFRQMQKFNAVTLLSRSWVLYAFCDAKRSSSALPILPFSEWKKKKSQFYWHSQTSVRGTDTFLIWSYAHFYPTSTQFIHLYQGSVIN